MKINDLFEKRRNPEQNPKINVYDFIMSYADDDNAFLHTTNVEKVGINPKTAKRTSDDTPAGVYTFHIKSILDNIEYGKEYNKPLALSLPYYGGNQLYILKSKVPVSDTLQTYSHDDLQKDMAKLKDKYGTELIEKFIDIAPTNENFVNAPIGYLWAVTKAIAIGGEPSELSHQQYPDAIKWNTVLRELGHNVLVDAGYGWIHNAERTQALFLSSDSYEVVDHMNVNRKQEIIKIGGKEYKGGRLPKDIHIQSIDDTEIANLSVTEQTKKVRSVTINQVNRIGNVSGIIRVFPNAEIIIEKVIVPQIRKLIDSELHKRIIERVKIERLIFSEEFPKLPTHIEMLEDIKSYVKYVEYTPSSIDNYGRITPPDEEKYSSELFKKIRPYAG